MHLRHKGMVPLVLVLSLITPLARSTATPGSEVLASTDPILPRRQRFHRPRHHHDPGGSTGWHWHDGTLIGAIKQGTLTHYAANCSVDGVYNPGDPITEPAGSDHVHVGRNLGATPVILEVIYINPAGKPLAQDAANPGCPFA